MHDLVIGEAHFEEAELGMDEERGFGHDAVMDRARGRG
jgi:hypothetical protein